MASEKGLLVVLENGNGVSEITPSVEGLVLNVDKENEITDNGIDITETFPNADGLNASGVEGQALSNASETMGSNPPKKLGAVKNGTTDKDKKGNKKGSTVVAQSKKPSLSQSLSFMSRGVANGLKKSTDGKPVKTDTKVDGTDSKSSVYARLSNPTRRVSTGGSSIETKPTIDGSTPKRASLASVPSVRRSAPGKSDTVKASVDGPASEVTDSYLTLHAGPNYLMLAVFSNDFINIARSTTPHGSRRSSGSGFAFRLDERAEKRKEFYSKIEEKIHAKEVEKNNLQAKSKESQEADLKQLRKNLTFKAAPMPTFYKEPPPPKTELKKAPSTRPISPKLGRHKISNAVAESSTEGIVSCKSPVSSSNGNPSKSTGKGSLANSNGDFVSVKKTVRKSLSKLPPQKSATTKTEAKLNSKPKSKDTELESEIAHDGETGNPSRSTERASEETECGEFKIGRELNENAETSAKVFDPEINSDIVAIDN
ncbi:hypothetical protein IFM89_000364 [Coptis chinensis]|uniref:TPX2 C-terminal domain-containing protein n=1 Tax=Coptis chinensis TaxID=261450 RepID=A0A835H9Y4_9MAGN|nr:hypothetical protein IFM89_000364 [Coptis chinensis]